MVLLFAYFSLYICTVYLFIHLLNFDIRKHTIINSLIEKFICSVPASILRKSTSGRHRPVSYPDGPMTPDIDLRRMLTGVLQNMQSTQYVSMSPFIM